MNELTIKPADWIGILFFGVLFSASLSMLGYRLVDLRFTDGALFGVALGFFITLYSYLFITLMNRRILPLLHRRWWDLTAAFFSFLAGFLGTLTVHAFLSLSDIALAELLRSHPAATASAVGVLTYLMGALMYRLVKVRNEKEDLDRLFAESRIRSLETQLNPHFLFNALNSLAELVHQNPDKAETAILKMSAFLRNTMGEKALISLDEELRNVRDYVDLENLRYPNPIELVIDRNELSAAWIVPKFSVQLLCENAIKHSHIPNHPFTIRIECGGDTLRTIRVSNNGKAVESRRFGIGLSNLSERLRHLCKGDVVIESLSPPCYRIDLKECS